MCEMHKCLKNYLNFCLWRNEDSKDGSHFKQYIFNGNFHLFKENISWYFCSLFLAILFKVCLCIELNLQQLQNAKLLQIPYLWTQAKKKWNTFMFVFHTKHLYPSLNCVNSINKKWRKVYKRNSVDEKNICKSFKNRTEQQQPNKARIQCYSNSSKLYFFQINFPDLKLWNFVPLVASYFWLHSTMY